MSFPSSGSGYPQQGGTPYQQPQPPSTGGFPQQGGSSVATLNVGVFLALAVTVLGLVNYFISFSEDASGADQAVQFLLIGGLLAAVRVLPRGPKVVPFATVASVLGGLYAILIVIRVPERAEVPGVVTVVLILGILQMLVAVAALLFDYDVIKLPAGQPQSPYGQQAQPAQAQGQYYQPTQYAQPYGQQAQPGQAASSAQQPTQYAAQQGQFYPQQQAQPQQHAQEGEQQKNPGTPPGGFGDQR